MGKLHELATLCVNNRDFYLEQGGRITNIYDDYPRNSIKTKYGLHTITPTPNNNDYGSITSEFFKKYGKDEYFTLLHQLKIEFKDHPPLLLINYDSLLKEEDFNDSVVITKKTFFGKKEKTFNIVFSKQTFKRNYVLKCGSIREYITEDEYKTLVKSYITNDERFQNDTDMAKIDERISLLKTK